MFSSANIHVKAIAALGVFLGVACAEPKISTPEWVPLQVEVSVDAEIDSELRLIVDGKPATTLDPSGGHVTLEVQRGRRVIQLVGVPESCTARDGLRRVIDIQPFGRVNFLVRFDVSCPPVL